MASLQVPLNASIAPEESWFRSTKFLDACHVVIQAQTATLSLARTHQMKSAVACLAPDASYAGSLARLYVAVAVHAPCVQTVLLYLALPKDLFDILPSPCLDHSKARSSPHCIVLSSYPSVSDSVVFPMTMKACLLFFAPDRRAGGRMAGRGRRRVDAARWPRALHSGASEPSRLDHSWPVTLPLTHT
jgi:hypothetical protein